MRRAGPHPVGADGESDAPLEATVVRQGCRVWGLPPRLDTALHAQDPAMGSQGPTESQGLALHVVALSSHQAGTPRVRKGMWSR